MPGNGAPRLRRIGVLGAGAWGTALSIAIAEAGSAVTLWARRPELAAALERERRNEIYLPGVNLDETIAVTADLAQAADCDALLLVVPAQHLRALAERLAPLIAPDCPLVICCKGIELESGALMSEVLEATLPGRPQAVLSGPSFAAEVARGLPTAVTLAAQDAALGEALIASVGSRTFRPYLSDDPVGAEIGGAVKNVVAIACGIVAGRKLGENARAALITRSLAEIVRLGKTKGARSVTFMGLSGIGDLLLTCASTQSRNYSLGMALGDGQSLADLLRDRHSVAEGVFTAGAVAGTARAKDLDMPIILAVDAVLNHGTDIGEAIEGLLARPFRAEWM